MPEPVKVEAPGAHFRASRAEDFQRHHRAKPGGWDGRVPDARLEVSEIKLLCPRCGSAALLLRVARDGGLCTSDRPRACL